ncbi:hypothetical protein SLEP1_g24834 [Rubroshorea leprosula]|uniref:SMP-LTD domain-containing protein n=2 Tax=Rubroshorea leprosula TaxID=152421 RepID=A0AAV5JU71_9ROSI|nr:hypothetical protein SLEP1_g24834 [Rubroshorea leprosula]
MILSLSLLLSGFLVGVLAILALEAVGVLYVLSRLSQKTKQESSVDEAKKGICREVDSQQSLDFADNKQGMVWILEPEKVPKNSLVEKVLREQKRKRDFFEVSPVQKYAIVKDQKLILKDTDGTKTTTIQLKGCTIEAVSASSFPSRKWAKRFPIKVENKTSLIYDGSKILYLYLETSWEKESWCKALRLASSEDKEKLLWFTKLNEDFHSFLVSLNAGYPSFMKPSTGFNTEPTDKGHRFDGSSSKVRLFWKKFSRKTSAKSSVESKGTWTNPSIREERKTSDKLHSSQDSVTNKVSNSSVEENTIVPPLSTCFHSGSQNYTSVASDAESEDRFSFDEGILCLNLLISRLFFDAKSNTGLKTAIQARIQRTLSNMRTPTYIGDVICTDIDVGNLPPYIHGMRLLPADMKEVWAFEVDIEYSGGAVLNVETRLEVREPDLQKGIIDTTSEQNSSGNLSSELLEGFEYYGKQLNLSEGTLDVVEQKNEADAEPKVDGVKSYKGTVLTTNYLSRWKSMLNSIAKQVSQVPLSLSIRVASLRGTLQLRIKPPPSDQLWFGFTSMPDIEFDLESSVGEHKITSGHIALFLINRFKSAIRETMVLPNSESVCLPWMLAEKDDWVQKKVAPFIWHNQEAVGDNSSLSEPCSPQLTEAKSKETSNVSASDCPESKYQKHRKAESFKQPISEASSTVPSIKGSKSLQELKTPLLAGDELHEACNKNIEEIPACQSTSRSSVQLGKQNSTAEDDDSRPKKTGRRARMLDLGKKMGEKFEEKRRHLEERSRHIVEKMRGNEIN